MMTSMLKIFFIAFVWSMTTLQTQCQLAEKLPPDVNFVKLSKSPIYVDKTSFLKDFFTNKTFHNFVTCPRCFGKTTMIRMIKTFAQIELDKSKKRIYWKDTHAFTVFQNLSIWQNYPSIVARHLAHYVVIALHLNMDHLKRPNERKIMKFLYEQIVEQYDRYKWIFKGGYNVTTGDIEYMKKVQNGTLNKLEQNLCIFRLAKILYKVFDKTKVIILVDDYDSAFTKLMYQPDFDITEYYQLLNHMLSRTYKAGLEYIDYVLVTGTSSMSYYIDQAKIQGIAHRPFLDDHRFVSFCGILEKELIPTLDKFEFDELERYKVKECYDGYTSRSKHRTIYNPNSIRKYLESRHKIKPSKYWTERYEGRNSYFPQAKEVPRYWLIPDRDFIIFEFFCFYEFFSDISIPANTENREETTFMLSKTYNGTSIHKFIELVKHVLNYLDYVPRLAKKRDIYVPIIRTFVFENGYFTHSRKKDDFYGVPNCEVRIEVAEKVDNFNKKTDPNKFV